MASKVLKPVAETEPVVPTSDTEGKTLMDLMGDQTRTSGDKILDVFDQYEKVNHTKSGESERSKIDVSLRFDLNDYWNDTTVYFSQAVQSARKGSGLTPNEFGLVGSFGLNADNNAEQAAKDFRQRHEELSKGQFDFSKNPMADNEWMAHYMYSLTEEGQVVEGDDSHLLENLRNASQQGLVESGRLTERQTNKLHVVAEDLETNGAKPSSVGAHVKERADQKTNAQSTQTAEEKTRDSRIHEIEQPEVQSNNGQGLSGIVQYVVVLLNQLLDSLRGKTQQSKETFAQRTIAAEEPAVQTSEDKHNERVAEAEEMAERVCSKPNSATKAVSLEF